MKVLVIGAAGKTGRAVVQKALEAGHEVTALVHSPGGVFPHGVDVRAGDARDPQTMDTAVAGQDAVIDTVGGKTPYRSSPHRSAWATASRTLHSLSGSSWRPSCAAPRGTRRGWSPRSAAAGSTGSSPVQQS